MAEYGDVCPGAISLVGSSCSTPTPASRSHGAIGDEIADLADAPAPRRRHREQRQQDSGSSVGVYGASHQSIGPSIARNMREAPARNSPGLAIRLTTKYPS